MRFLSITIFPFELLYFSVINSEQELYQSWLHFFEQSWFLLYSNPPSKFYCYYLILFLANPALLQYSLYVLQEPIGNRTYSIGQKKEWGTANNNKKFAGLKYKNRERHYMLSQWPSISIVLKGKNWLLVCYKITCCAPMCDVYHTVSDGSDKCFFTSAIMIIDCKHNCSCDNDKILIIADICDK